MHGQDLQEREATSEEDKATRRQARALQLRRMLIQSVAKALVNEAVKRGSSDNVSAVVVAVGKDS
jgi:serine/threonine protein phosphatase PrpC